MPSVPFQQPVVAAFDLDGTLTTRDCVVPFLRAVVGDRHLLSAFARHPLRSASLLVRRDRDGLKAMAVAPFDGRSTDEIAEAGERFAADVIPGWLRTDTVARLRQHLDLGHRVVVISASLSPYVHPLARQLGADAALCSELEAESGRLTGRLVGANCRGAEKVRRLREWLGDEADSVELWAYGDSGGDRELLAAAAHRTLVTKAVVLGALAA